jgi:uncharacterized protein
MTRIVLDTNVLVSGMINAYGPPGRIVDLMREGIVELVVEDRILTEYSEVLNRPKFNAYFHASDVRDILVFLEQNAHYVVSTTQVADISDLDDAPFIEVALTAAVPLITGNASHFPAHYRSQTSILTPAEFIAAIL